MVQSEIICAFFFFVVLFVVKFEKPLKNYVFDHTKRESRRLFQISFNVLTSSHARMLCCVVSV